MGPEKESRGKRKRIFTKPEFLKDHPIVKLFGMKETKEILAIRKESCLHFSDMQLLLCEKKPLTRPRGCLERRECEKCKRYDKCCIETPLLFAKKFIEARGDNMRKYSSKVRLAIELRRLTEAHILRKVDLGRYEIDRRCASEMNVALRKRNLTEFIKKCPVDKIRNRGDALLFYVGEEFSENKGANLGRIDELSSALREELLSITARATLSAAMDAFERELKGLTDDRQKVYLWRYFLAHAKTRLAGLQIDEGSMREELARIEDADIGIPEDSRKSIEKESREDESIVRKAKSEIAMASWLDGMPLSDADKYDMLMMETLFSFDSAVGSEFNDGKPSKEVMKAFREHHQKLSPDAKISTVSDGRWRIADDDNIYEIRNVGRSVRVYRRMQLPEAELKKKKNLLRAEEAFEKWFSESDMCIPASISDFAPIFVID